MEKRRRVQDLVGYADIDLIDLFLRGVFKEGDKVLEVGCGEGKNLQLFTNSSINYYGLDNSESAVKMSKVFLRSKDPKFDDEQIQKADIVDHHFPNKAFDWILAINVLQHCKTVNEFSALTKAIVKLLNDRGSIMLKSTTMSLNETIAFPLDKKAIDILRRELPNHTLIISEKKKETRNEIILLFKPKAQAR